MCVIAFVFGFIPVRSLQYSLKIFASYNLLYQIACYTGCTLDFSTQCGGNCIISSAACVLVCVCLCTFIFVTEFVYLFV